MNLPPGTHGSYYDRMCETAQLSEDKRREVVIRSKNVRETALNNLARRAALQKHRPPDTTRGDVYATQCVNEDPSIKLAIGGEQWGCRLATMYGTLHIAETITNILQEIQRTNTLLEELITATHHYHNHLDMNNHL